MATGDLTPSWRRDKDRAMSFSRIVYFFFPERRYVSYEKFLHESRESMQRVIPWGGFLAFISWIPFLFADGWLFPHLASELFYLRLILIGSGLITVVSCFSTRLRRHSFFWGNFLTFALQHSTVIITNIVNSDPRYISGYLLAIVIISLFPMPFTHRGLQLILSLAHYLILAYVWDSKLFEIENQYSLINVFIAFVATILMMYIGERLRLRFSIQKATLQKTQEELHIRNEQLESDIYLARAIQQNLLPKKFPSNEKIQVSGHYESMEDVGGDYYDVISESEDEYLIFIADASGHGVSAAMISAMSKLSFHHALKAGLNMPDEIFTFLNHEIRPFLLEEHYLTGFVIAIDFSQKTISYTNAAHRPPFLITDDGKVRELDTDGNMLGMFRDGNYDCITEYFQENSLIIFYTDGIIEATNSAGIEYGPERLVEVAQANRRKPLHEITEILRQDVLNFCKDKPLNDDLTLLVVRMHQGNADISQAGRPIQGKRSQDFISSQNAV